MRVLIPIISHVDNRFFDDIDLNWRIGIRTFMLVKILCSATFKEKYFEIHDDNVKHEY